MFVFCLREDTAYLLHWQKRNRLIKCNRTTMRLFLLQCMQALVHCKQVFEGTSAQEGDPGYFHTLKGMLGSVSWHHALWSLCRATGGAKPASGTQGPLTAFAPSPKPEHKALHKASFDVNVIGHDGTSAACSQALWATGCKSIQVSQILPLICAKSNIMQHAYLLPNHLASLMSIWRCLLISTAGACEDLGNGVLAEAPHAKRRLFGFVCCWICWSCRVQCVI